MKSRYIHQYNKIVQINFLMNPLIKVVKISNYKTEYLSHFGGREAKFLLLYLSG